ncbi:MAG: hypothetical protein H0U44_07390 [Flavisolibacter sp.]|jgi:hypothetical protein|nr:hypothetical protein [Flavisolibacter sp.]
MEATNDITDFLKTGQFFEIKIGLDEKLVLKTFQAQLEHSFSLDSSKGYYYHFAEIVFYNGRLQNIIIGGKAIHNLFVKTDANSYKISRTTTLSAIAKILNQSSIGWKFNKEVVTDKSFGIVTEGGVNILFDFTDTPIIGKIVI